MIKNIRLFYYFIPAVIFILGTMLGGFLFRSFDVMYSKNIIFSMVFVSLPAVLLYYIVLAVIKLIVEFKRGKTGTQYQVGILLSFFLIIALIMGPFIFFMNNILNRSFDIWMMSDLKNALDGGHKLSQLLESDTKRKLTATTDRIIENLKNGTQPVSDDLDLDYFKLYSKGSPAGFVSKDKDDFNLITQKDIIEYKDGNDLFLRKKFNHKYYLVYLKQIREENQDSVIITAAKIAPELYLNMAAIEKGYIIYQQINVFQKPYQKIIFMVMMDLVLLVLFIAVLLSILFAKRISSPILKLYDGIQNIAAGRLDHMIQYPKNDEMKILISSFNNMIKELSFNQQAVQHSRHMEAWKKMSIRIIDDLKKRILELTSEFNQLAVSLPESSVARLDIAHFQGQIRDLSLMISEFDAMTNSTKLPLKKENLNDIIRDVVEMFESVNLNVSFHVELDNSLPLMNINRDEIHQVLINLLKNGLEAIPLKAKGVIRILTQNQRTLQGSFVKLEVSDNGIGIRDDILPRIYDPYFTTKKRKQGLGLTIVKKVLSDHEARISYKRLDGRSIFTIEFQTE